MLKTETNTLEVSKQIHGLFDSENLEIHHRLSSHFEHGHWWITCLDCGMAWAVVDVEDEKTYTDKYGETFDDLDIEIVSEGDYYCYTNVHC